MSLPLRNALEGIATSTENIHIIKLGPGTYDLGSTGLTMEPFVSIDGAGEMATKITSTASDSATPPTVATVRGPTEQKGRCRGACSPEGTSFTRQK